jgi:hypothetical protein
MVADAVGDQRVSVLFCGGTGKQQGILTKFLEGVLISPRNIARFQHVAVQFPVIGKQRILPPLSGYKEGCI